MLRKALALGEELKKFKEASGGSGAVAGGDS